jgi:hypothetical protein
VADKSKTSKAKWETIIEGHDIIVETVVVDGTVATNVRKRTDKSSEGTLDKHDPSRNSLVARFTSDANAKSRHDSTVDAVRGALHLTK